MYLHIELLIGYIDTYVAIFWDVKSISTYVCGCGDTFIYPALIIAS